jgi:hypothetical protein
MFLPRGDVVTDAAGIAWEAPRDLTWCAEKLETGLTLLEDARVFAAGGQIQGMLSNEQFEEAKGWLVDLHKEQSEGKYNAQKQRGAFRAFIKETVGDWSLFLDLLRHGTVDDNNDLATRFLRIQEAKAQNAQERQQRPTRATHPELYARVREARQKYYRGQALEEAIYKGTHDYFALSSEETEFYQEYLDGKFKNNMDELDAQFGTGINVAAQLSAEALANLRLRPRDGNILVQSAAASSHGR